ncbi:cell division protein FtsK [Fictibacillus sp. 7GRE50]|uniref:FtsK/SpoIIIE domain-containing protein n=1 Tax=Fictibacillus sp. 7GRE50 TaxID=2745878 RepID=UPI0018CF06FF|nr:FtsK/SpoIIIE domain-containing protein [Fictibacillus sp. 7GRE50]MBH0166294.1 cell division protein FtsK [Fictibacillus sp. 7GRE50]
MLFEVASSLLFGSMALYAKTKQSGGTGMSDGQKIQRIFSNTGLNVKEGEKILTAQLIRNNKRKWGRELVFRIPLGRSFEDYHKKINSIQDGLNTKKRNKTFDFQALIKFDIKNIMKKEKAAQKEIEMSYDGMLKIKIYNQPMPEKKNYKEIEIKDDWKVPIGVTRTEAIFHDFDSIYNMLVGGAVGGGKSAFLVMAICHLLQTQPENVWLTLIDLKGGVEFNRFKDCYQVVGYAEEVAQAKNALENVVSEMKQTLALLKVKRLRNVIEANLKRRHFIVIDEIGELASHKEVDKETKKLKEECEYLLSNICRLGRAMGVRVIVATQHPTADVVPIQVKRNCDARVCYKVDTVSASMVVLDSSGADQLPINPGRAIYKKGADKFILQTPWLSDVEADQIIKINSDSDAKESVVEDEQTSRNDFNLFEDTPLS